MLTDNGFKKIVLLLCVILIVPFAVVNRASAESSAPALTSIAPASGQAGVTNIVVHGTGFAGGVIPPGKWSVLLTPGGGGAPVTAPAYPVGRLADTGAVSFIVPSSIAVSSPVEYSVSLVGTTADGSGVSSTNALSLIVNPPPSMALGFVSGPAGQTIRVEINGTFTSFSQGITAASFGPGISVGSGGPGGWGLVTVNGATSATAVIRIDPLAATGPRTVMVRTGPQEVSAEFTVETATADAGQTAANDAETAGEPAATAYSIVDLGALGGVSSEAYSVNDYGHVTGYMYYNDGTYRAFLYDGKTMHDLSSVIGSSYSVGNHVNLSDQVTGIFVDNSVFHAFRYYGGSVVDLNNLSGVNWSKGYGINDSGWVAGTANMGSGSHAFFYNGSTITDLGNFSGISGTSEGRGINSTGQVTGWGTSDSSKGYFHAFRHDGGKMTDLGTLGGNNSYGNAINDAGQVTGSAEDSNKNDRAFLYNGGMIDLGTLGGKYSEGLGINGSGQVVGWSSSSGGDYHAFLYKSGVGMKDLNELIPSGSGWTLTYACGINSSGNIVGWGVNPSGYHHAFLLTGVPDLAITKSHKGNFKQGQTGATYSIKVSNVGMGPTSGKVTVTDTMPPAGLTATSMVGSGWSCDVSTYTCTRSDVLASGESYPTIALKVTVASDAPASVTNTAKVSGGGDVSTANNTANDPTTIVAAYPVLAITKTHKGSFKQGQVGATYTIRVKNTGNGQTTSAVTVTDTLPAEFTATSFKGSGWICDPLPALSCQPKKPYLLAGKSYSPITLKVNVDAEAPASLTNTVTVSGGGADDSSATDPTTIIPVAPDMTIKKKHSGKFKSGRIGSYTIKVTNSGNGPTTAAVTVTDTLPAGLSLAFCKASGWNCTTTSNSIACTRSNVLKARASYPPITLKVNITAAAGASLTNTATVAGGGERDPGNNTGSDSVTIY